MPWWVWGVGALALVSGLWQAAEQWPAQTGIALAAMAAGLGLKLGGWPYRGGLTARRLLRGPCGIRWRILMPWTPWRSSWRSVPCCAGTD